MCLHAAEDAAQQQYSFKTTGRSPTTVEENVSPRVRLRFEAPVLPEIRIRGVSRCAGRGHRRRRDISGFVEQATGLAEGILEDLVPGPNPVGPPHRYAREPISE